MSLPVAERAGVLVGLFVMARRHAGSIAIRVGTIVLTGAGVLITARALPPAERGLLALLMVPVNQIVSFAGAGMRQPIAKLEMVHRHLRTVSGTAVVAITGGALLTFIWCVFRATPRSAAIAASLGGVMIGVAFLEAMATSTGDVKKVLRGQLLVQMIFIPAIVGLAILRVSVPLAFVAAQGLAFIVTARLLYWTELRALGETIPKFSRVDIATSSKFATSALAVTLLCKIDVIAAAFVLPRAELGYYVVAAAFGEFLLQFPALAGFLVFAETKADVADKGRRLRTIVARSWGLAVVAGLLVALGVPVLLRYVLGASYAEAARLVPWLMPTYAFAAAIRVSAGFVAAVGDVALLLRTALVGGSIFTIVLFVGFKPASPIAIAVAAAIATLSALFTILASTRFDPYYG